MALCRRLDPHDWPPLPPGPHSYCQVASLVDAVILLRCLLRALPALSESLAWVTTPLLQAVRGRGRAARAGNSGQPMLPASVAACQPLHMASPSAPASLMRRVRIGTPSARPPLTLAAPGAQQPGAPRAAGAAGAGGGRAGGGGAGEQAHMGVGPWSSWACSGSQGCWQVEGVPEEEAQVGCHGGPIPAWVHARVGSLCGALFKETMQSAPKPSAPARIPRRRASRRPLGARTRCGRCAPRWTRSWTWRAPPSTASRVRGVWTAWRWADC